MQSRLQSVDQKNIEAETICVTCREWCEFTNNSSHVHYCSVSKDHTQSRFSRIVWSKAQSLFLFSLERFPLFRCLSVPVIFATLIDIDITAAASLSPSMPASLFKIMLAHLKDVL